MIFDLNKTREVFPEIGDTFTVVNNDKTYVLHVEKAEDPTTCDGCAFEAFCKDNEYNQTQFTCHGEERPDKTDVIFVWK